MRYIGSKKSLAKRISLAIAEYGAPGNTIADLFAGTGAVAREFKKSGYSVIAADLLCFPYVLQRAYIQISSYPAFDTLLSTLDFTPFPQGELFPLSQAEQQQGKMKYIVHLLNELPGSNGFISNNYTPLDDVNDKVARRYFTHENGQRIDSVFQQIRKWKQDNLLTEDEYYLLLAAALEAVPLVANILGTFGAFKKGDWESRAVKPYRISEPRLIASSHTNYALQGDANQIVRNTPCDLLYLDPPYNNRQYAEYYHLLETLAEGVEPEIAGLTGKPTGLRRLSRYCTKSGAKEQFEDLVTNAQTRHIFLSYSEDGLLTEEEIMQALSLRGNPSVPIKLAEHPRYRSDRNRDEEGERKRQYQERKTVNEWLYHVKITK